MISDSEISPLANNVDAKYGYSFSASLRFYPIEVLEGFYIAPEFKFRKYNWDREADYYLDEAPYSGVQDVSESRIKWEIKWRNSKNNSSRKVNHFTF